MVKNSNMFNGSLQIYCWKVVLFAWSSLMEWNIVEENFFHFIHWFHNCCISSMICENIGLTNFNFLSIWKFKQKCSWIPSTGDITKEVIVIYIYIKKSSSLCQFVASEISLAIAVIGCQGILCVCIFFSFFFSF